MSHAATAERSASPQAGAHDRGTASNARSREVLSFRLGSEEYGIDILTVQEIRGYEAPTRIANASDYVKGVINLRGVIVPVVDMRIRLHLEQVVYDAFTVTIVLNVLGRTIGMVVDAVSDVIELKGGQIKPAPEFNGAIDANCITGLGTVKTGDTERMLILMDIQHVMACADLGLAEPALH